VGLSIADLLGKTSSPERVRKICLNGKLRGEYDVLREELDGLSGVRATMGVDPRAQELAEQMQALEAEMAESTVTFRFRGLSHWRLKEIQRKFPSDDPRLSWDTDAASPLLISECLIEPALTEAEVKTLLDQGNARLTDELFSVAWLACNQDNDVPKSARASELTRAGE
jgi:hypothetical protein